MFNILDWLNISFFLLKYRIRVGVELCCEKDDKDYNWDFGDRFFFWDRLCLMFFCCFGEIYEIYGS